MKVLVVTPFLPSPPRFGGQRRIDGIVRNLARRHELSILSFNRPDPWCEVSLAETRSYCREVVTLTEQDFETADKRKLQLRSLASRKSFDYLVKARRHDFQRELDRLLRTNTYDVVQFEFMQMAVYEFSRSASRPVFVLDEHNVEYDLVRRTAGAGSSPVRRLYDSLNWRKLEREEHAAWRRFDGLVFTSERDAEFVQRAQPGARTRVAPNGVDVDAFVPVEGGERPDRILFFGAINYFPNHDGVAYFIDEIFPKIRARRPNATFAVVGPGAPPEILARAGNGVEILGMVDEVAPHLDAASVVVVPLRAGGGTRLKIVEALAKGKAIVSTRVGAEGIDVVNGEHLLLADTPGTFAAEVERLLNDAELRRRLGRSGRQLAEERYGWPRIVSGLEQFYAELLAAK